MNEREMMEAIGRVARVEAGEAEAREAVAGVRSMLLRRQWRARLMMMSGVAAVVVLGAGVWVMWRGHEVKPVERPQVVERVQVEDSDEAFEKWAAPYRKLRVPMVSREAAGSYAAPEVAPVLSGPRM